MNPLSAKIQERLQNIREKYSERPTSYDKRSKTPTSYLPHQLNDTRRSTIQPSYHPENPEKYANMRGDISNKKASLTKEIQKIRENYAASRKKILDDFSRQPNTNKNHQVKEYIGHVRNINDDLIGRDRGYSDHLGQSKEFHIGHYKDSKKDYLNPVSKITQSYDFRQLNDKLRPRQYTLGRQSEKQLQYSGFDKMDRINKEYAKALQKAYEFSKENDNFDYKYSAMQYPSPAKREFDKLANLGRYDRQFGKDCNALHPRLSFGKQQVEKSYMRDTYSKFDLDFENSSPIKKIKQFDSTRKDFKALNQYELSSLQLGEGKRNSRSMIGLKEENYIYDSPIKNQKNWINKFDNVQSKIKGYLHEKQMRF